MARRRFRRKDLKRPDEFVSRGRAYIEWAQANVRTLSWGVGGAALLALVVAGYFSLRSARVRQANDDLDRAIAEFHAGHYSQAAAQFADVAAPPPVRRNIRDGGWSILGKALNSELLT